jgi:spermidine synthase
MKPTTTLARETTPEGKELVLYRRDGIYTLRVDGLELMTSRAHGSEEALARLACEGLEDRRAPRVLVGGLGFGYTLRSTLDLLPHRSSVVVCEIFESLLTWNRDFLDELAGRPLEDPRVEALCVDVWDVLDRSELFDAILLDVDKGPWALTLLSNERLYQSEGLTRLASSLKKTGRLAIWSSGASPDFERRLRRAGFEVTTERVSGRGRRGPRHTIFVAVQR